MTEPPRLFDAPDSPLERDLLAEARSYRVNPETILKTSVALGLSGVAWFSLKSALAAPLSAVAHATPVKAALLAGGVISTGVMAGVYLHEAETPANVPPLAPADTASHSRSNFEPPPAVPSAEAVNPESLPIAQDEAELAAPASTPRQKSPARSSARAELEQLDRVRAALMSSKPSDALSELSDYSRQFPKGKLALEAEALRIDALAKSGRHAEAKRRALAFVEKHPKSFLAARVRRHMVE